MDQNNQVQCVGKPIQLDGKQMSLKDLVGMDSVRKKFEDIQGKIAGKFLASLLSLAANDKLLSQASPQTVLTCAQIAATLDLPINKNLGFAYIIGYKNGKTGIIEAQFQIGYKGIVQLALRSGQYAKLETGEVYEGEIKRVNRFTGEYEFGERTSDKVVGYLAYFKLVNGMEKFYYMSKEDVERHARKYSQNYRKDKDGMSLWSTMFGEMAKKTVLKLLISKFGPMSVDMQQAVTFDQAVARPKKDEDISDIEDVDYEYVDNRPASQAESLAELGARSEESVQP